MKFQLTQFNDAGDQVQKLIVEAASARRALMEHALAQGWLAHEFVLPVNRAFVNFLGSGPEALNDKQIVATRQP